MAGNDVEIRVRVRDYASPALRNVERNTRVMASQLGAAARGLAMLGAGGSAIPVLLGVAAAAAQAAGALLVLPGAVAAAAAVTGTLTLALSGVSEALAAAAAGGAAYDEALAKLAPNARELVEAMRALTPEWEALQRSVQNRFFQGMAADISTLADTYIPLLDTGLGNIAGSLNGMIGYGFDSIMKPESIADINSILANTSLFLDNAGTALGDFLAGFLGLAEVGSGFLPQFGTWLSDIAAQFLAWTENGDGANGSIQTLIEDGIAGFQTFWQFLTDIWLTIQAIIGGLSGEDDAGFLGGMLTSVREFAEDESTQVLLGFIGDLARAIVELAPYWIPLALGIKGASIAMGIFNAIMAANPIMLVVIGIAALVAAFMWAWNNVAGFKEFWVGAWNLIVGGFNMAKDAIVGGITWIGDRLAGFANWVGSLDIFGALAAGARGALNGALSAINGLISGINVLIDGMNWVNPFGDIPRVPYIRYLATGGISGGGMTVVGERGPELLNLPSGSSVRSAGDTQRMLEQGGSGGGGTARFELVAGPGADSAVATMIMKLIRSGDIQIQAA